MKTKPHYYEDETTRQNKITEVCMKEFHGTGKNQLNIHLIEHLFVTKERSAVELKKITFLKLDRLARK